MSSLSPHTRNATIDRELLVRRGRLLAWATVVWNAIEGVVAIVSGVLAGSIALIGFGVDSYVEVLSGAVIVWRLSKEGHGAAPSHAAERRAVRIIAVSFLLLAVGIAAESLRDLATAARPDESLAGIILAAVSLVVMPLLARAKHDVGRRLGSRAVQADAAETLVCVWLSGVLLAGLGLNAMFGWWWADPLAALAVAYIALHEGLENWRSETVVDCC